LTSHLLNKYDTDDAQKHQTQTNIYRSYVKSIEVAGSNGEVRFLTGSS